MDFSWALLGLNSPFQTLSYIVSSTLLFVCASGDAHVAMMTETHTDNNILRQPRLIPRLLQSTCSVSRAILQTHIKLAIFLEPLLRQCSTTNAGAA